MQPSTPAISNKFVTEFRIQDVDHAPWLPANAKPLLEKILGQSAIWTGWVDGKVVAVCGITLVHPHYGHCWTYLHPDALTHRYWLHRRTKRILQNYVRASELFRVDAVCLASHVEASVWLDRLGLKRESGPMRYYGPQGETMVRHVWFPRGING